MARFLKADAFDTDGDSLSDYIHTGNTSLSPSTSNTLSGAIRFEGEGYRIALTGRESRIDRMVTWDRHEDSLVVLYSAVARDADHRALSASIQLTPFAGTELLAGYTYACLEDRDDGSNLSLMPRHNLYTSVSWKMHIGRFRLDVFPSLEVEYHSTNHASHVNTESLDDYVLANGMINFKIKSFTFYYSMENIFDTEHRTVNDYLQYRQVWWGFRWIFRN
jgi:outer membrane cobalamin receptor